MCCARVPEQSFHPKSGLGLHQVQHVEEAHDAKAQTGDDVFCFLLGLLGLGLRGQRIGGGMSCFGVYLVSYGFGLRGQRWGPPFQTETGGGIKCFCCFLVFWVRA